MIIFVKFQFFFRVNTFYILIKNSYEGSVVGYEVKILTCADVSPATTSKWQRQ